MSKPKRKPSMISESTDEFVRRVLEKQKPDDVTVKETAAKIDAYIKKVNDHCVARRLTRALVRKD